MIPEMKFSKQDGGIIRATERILEAQGKIKKWGPYVYLVGVSPTFPRGVWGHAPQKCFEILGALRCSEAF